MNRLSFYEEIFPNIPTDIIKIILKFLGDRYCPWEYLMFCQGEDVTGKSIFIEFVCYDGPGWSRSWIRGGSAQISGDQYMGGTEVEKPHGGTYMQIRGSVSVSAGQSSKGYITMTDKSRDYGDPYGFRSTSRELLKAMCIVSKKEFSNHNTRDYVLLNSWDGPFSLAYIWSRDKKPGDDRYL